MPRSPHRSAVTAFPADAASAGAARQFVRNTLENAGIDNAIRERAELIVSELVTNAVLHSSTGPVVSLSFDNTNNGIRLEVEDSSPSAPVLRDYGTNATTGRGLHIIATTADNWGIETRPSGKSVWVELLPGATSTSTQPDHRPTASIAVDQHADDTADQPLPTRSDPFATLLLDDEYSATFVDVPVALYLELERHNEALVREFSLLASETQTNVSAKHSRTLREAIELSKTFDVRFNVFRNAVQTATSRHQTSFSTSVTLSPRVIEQLQRFQQWTLMTQKLTQTGELLAPMPSAECIALQAWIITQAFAQFEHHSKPQAWKSP